MALKKKTKTKAGISGDYWTFTQIQIEPVKHKVTWVLSLFADKEQRAAGSDPLGDQIVFSQSELTAAMLGGDIRKLGYEIAKATEAVGLKDAEIA